MLIEIYFVFAIVRFEEANYNIFVVACVYVKMGLKTGQICGTFHDRPTKIVDKIPTVPETEICSVFTSERTKNFRVDTGDDARYRRKSVNSSLG